MNITYYSIIEESETSSPSFLMIKGNISTQELETQKSILHP